MIKKTIAYKDLDGQDKTEDYWFQLTQAEFVKKAMTEGGESYLEKLRSLSDLKEEDIANGGGKLIIDTFEVLLVDAVGKREGELLIKDDDVRKRFQYSGAYDALFMELLSTEDSGATFIRNMLPGNAQEAIDKALAEKAAAENQGTPVLEAAAPVLEEPGKDDKPAWLKELREPTSKELMEMPKAEMALAFRMREEGKLNVAAKPAN